jgi:hypothetical protein
MTTSIVRLIEARFAQAAQTTQYTATAKTMIDTFTVTNTGAANQTFSVNIVPASGSASASNRVLSVRTIVPGQTYHCPELVGKVLDVGQFLSTLASDATSLVMDATGRVVA